MTFMNFRYTYLMQYCGGFSVGKKKVYNLTTYFLKYELVNDKMFFGMDEFRRVYKIFTILFTQVLLAIFH